MTKISPKQIRPGSNNQVLKTVGGKAVWGEVETPPAPVLPLSIYGMVRGKIGSSAQVLNPRQVQDCLWDESKKIEQNIQYTGERNSNAWLIPEDGIYTVTASFEGVDLTKPFGLRLQRKVVNGAWGSITPVVLNAYPADNRGTVVTTTQHFKKGEMINCTVENFSDSATRLGEHSGLGTDQAYFSIVRVATLGMDTAVSTRPANRLVKTVETEFSTTSNKKGVFTLNIPSEFVGRKIKVTFRNAVTCLAAQDIKPTDLYNVDTTTYKGVTKVDEEPSFVRYIGGMSNYIEFTEVYEKDIDRIEVTFEITNTDNVTMTGNSWGSAIIETID